MTCPECKGEKGSPGIGCGDAGCRPMWMPCFLCGGKGEITDEMVEWVALGLKLRTKRKARNEIMRQGAKRYGITPVDLSYIETGRRRTWAPVEPCDPVDFKEDAAECVTCAKNSLCRDLQIAIEEYEKEKNLAI